MNNRVAPGQTFPDLDLPNHEGKRCILSDEQGQNALLLLIIRGAFCSEDREQLKELSRFYPQLDVGHCRVVVVTPDDPVTTQMLRQDVDAQYPFFCDEEKTVARELGLQVADGGAQHPMASHTFLLDRSRTVHQAWIGHQFWDRPSAAELHQQLRELARRQTIPQEQQVAAPSSPAEDMPAPPPSPGEATGNQGEPPNNLAD